MAMIENKQRQNRHSLLWKQICVFHTTKKSAQTWKLRRKCVSREDEISILFIAAGWILIMSESQSLLFTHTQPMTTIWWRIFRRFFRDSLSYLIAVDFINVSMVGKCNNRNIFSSAKFVGRYNAYTFLLCDLGVRRILIVYRKISDGLRQTMDAIACLGISKYETLVIKTFQFYLLIHAYIENWIKSRKLMKSQPWYADTCSQCHINQHWNAS